MTRGLLPVNNQEKKKTGVGWAAAAELVVGGGGRQELAEVAGFITGEAKRRMGASRRGYW